MRFGLQNCVLIAMITVAVATTVNAADPTGPVVIPIGSAYAATAINAAVFRVSALLTAGKYQFVSYYDPDAHIVVGRREIGQTTWALTTLPFTGNVHDAHNVTVLGISSDGLLHLSYDQHAQALHYRVSLWPFDVSGWGDDKPMTGQQESHVTYPEFISAADGSLYFFYRDGASGNGSLCINKYDAEHHAWQALQHPLIDGLNRCNPYWWRPEVAADGSIHVAWCWRDTPDAQTNHDICYMVSRDQGKSWLSADGKALSLPVTPESAPVVEAIKRGSNLINQCSLAVDAAGHPHLAQYFNDEHNVPQYFHLWFDGTKWNKDQVSHRTRVFNVNGTGTLAILMSRPEIAIGSGGNVDLITRDAEFGGGIRIYRALPPYHDWTAIDLTHDDLGNWEPTYDLSRLRTGGILSLFVLPVRQGNHERTTTFAPTTAEVLETPLP